MILDSAFQKKRMRTALSPGNGTAAFAGLRVPWGRRVQRLPVLLAQPPSPQPMTLLF
ncbi:hypothetical protein [Domibacillus iocasae]|uniref:hypothetical protein n=1 Tax=Domibacillus iocasae TaxID=1714016 RepID=UPI001470CC89|nr:hypothetical protein [Domibacillus iocasae]